MSENLSIEEMIARAEAIKSRTEQQLREAEKRLDERAKTAIQEVTVDAQSVVERVSAVTQEETDVKEYNPQKKKEASAFRQKKSDTRIIDIKRRKEKDTDSLEKTNKITLSGNDGEDNVKIYNAGKAEKTSPYNFKARFSDSNGDDAQNSLSKTKVVAFVSKTKVDEDSDLQSIPTIVAREKVYNSFESNEEEIGEQIRFEGFDDEIDVVPTIDEEEAEKQLLEQRRAKVGKFRLFGPDETVEDLGNSDIARNDFSNYSEKNDFLDGLYSKKKAVQIKNIISVVLGIPLFLISVFRDSAFLPDFLSSSLGYFLTVIILYVCIIGVNFNVIIHGFNLKKSLNSDFFVSIMVFGILAHTVALLCVEDLRIDNGMVLASSGAFSLFLSQAGKSRMMSRIIDNFEFIISSGDKYTVENIVNTVDAEIITRGFIDEEPIVKTSVKTDLPTNFLEISCKNEPADRLSKRFFPVMLLFTAALTVTVGLMDNFNTGINIGLAGLCISFPAASLFISNYALFNVSAQLNGFGSRVCGYEGAVMANDSNAMVMEAADLFARDSCELHGIKVFNGAKVDDAIVQAAAVIIQTKSPLAHVFDDVIIGKQSILPKVEDVKYEEKMGTSAWIYKRKVLVGNRHLLLNHGVSVPNEKFEIKYTGKNKKALYLAVDGEIIAMFVVGYTADPDLKRELKKLEKSGITLIVKSCDPYINEESLAALFSLPKGFLRVMNYSSARVYDKYSDMDVEKSPAYIVHNGTALGFVSAMRASKIIVSTKRLGNFLQIFGGAFGFVVIAMLSVIGMYTQITALNIILFQAVWSLFVLAVSKLRSIGL